MNEHMRKKPVGRGGRRKGKLRRYIKIRDDGPVRDRAEHLRRQLNWSAARRRLRGGNAQSPEGGTVNEHEQAKGQS